MMLGDSAAATIGWAQGTPVLMADATWRDIGAIGPGDEVVAFTAHPALGQNRAYECATVISALAVRADAVEITVAGRGIIASANHRVLACVRPYWRPVERVTLQTGLIDIGVPPFMPAVDSEPFLVGYLAGAIAGDGTFRISQTKQSYLRVAVLTSDAPILARMAKGFEALGCTDIFLRSFDDGRSRLAAPRPRQPMSKIETRRIANLVTVRDRCLPERDDAGWKAGFLGGLFDTDGSYSTGSLRFHQTKKNGVLDQAHRYIADLGFASNREDFRSTPGCSERIMGGLEQRTRFLATIAPALVRKATDVFGCHFPTKRATRIDGIRRVGTRDLVAIRTTSGTFIASGLATCDYLADVTRAGPTPVALVA